MSFFSLFFHWVLFTTADTKYILKVPCYDNRFISYKQFKYKKNTLLKEKEIIDSKMIQKSHIIGMLFIKCKTL